MSSHVSTRLATLAVAGLALTTACGGPTIDASRDPSVPIPASATWAWGIRDTVSRYELDPAAQNPMIHQYVQTAIENSLNQKGYRKVDDASQATLLVTYHMGIKHTTEYQTTTTGVGMYGGWYGGYGWGVYGAPTMSTSTTTPYEYRTGAVLVIIRDRATGRVAWQGLYKKDIHDPTQVSQQSVQMAANDLFKELRP